MMDVISLDRLDTCMVRWDVDDYCFTTEMIPDRPTRGLYFVSRQRMKAGGIQTGGRGTCPEVKEGRETETT